MNKEGKGQNNNSIESVKVTLLISGNGDLRQKKEAVKKMLHRCLPIGSNETVFFIEQFEIVGS